MSRQMTPSAGACAWIAKAAAILALLAWSLTHVNPALAQSDREPVRTVEVFATTADAVSIPASAPFALMVYRTDELEREQQAMLAPAGTGRDARETTALQQALLRKQGQAALHRLAPLVSRHYQAERLARQYGITAYPAIVINGSKVIYDVTDVERAISIYLKLHGV